MQGTNGQRPKNIQEGALGQGLSQLQKVQPVSQNQTANGFTMSKGKTPTQVDQMALESSATAASTNGIEKPKSASGNRMINKKSKSS